VTATIDYSKPRRLNAVSGTMLALALAAAYWGWRFGPAYWDAWTVDHILKETASSVYRANRLNEPLRTQTLRELVDKARAKMIHDASVGDPELAVNLNIDGDVAAMSADYHVVVTHPMIGKTTTLHFTRKETADVKVVRWE
jgi:hypothetical protein